MLISRLEIRNMRKIKQAEIDFHGAGVQMIEGMNQSGKTTIGQAIAITMNGQKDFTPGMIARGEEEAEIVAWTDNELKIRTVMAGSVRQSVARYDEGLRRHINVAGGVRAFLDSICSGLEQPWALRDVPDADVVEMLMSRSGASEKIAAIDAALAEREQLRTETGRDRKRLGDPGKPPEKVEHPDPIDGIKAEREKALNYQKAYAIILVETKGAIQKAVSAACTFEELEDIVPLLKKEAGNGRDKISPFGTYAKADVEALESKITEWFETEKKAKDYDAHIEKKTQCDNLDKQYKVLTAEIETLREQRRKALADMRLGVKGLEIGEDNMLYHNGVLRGITKSEKKGNWSTSESVQVFFGMGARFAGEMKVLVVDNAESLDAKTIDTITQWAEKVGFLVIMLRVAEVPEKLEEGVIYIREGEVLKK
ncbi:MAG: AAA family ATPase [Spirochaetia bacterium]|jgi:DNA repair ATPase RecN|nr:AAA family ATPase [Spirochaetia bacterium]